MAGTTEPFRKTISRAGSFRSGKITLFCNKTIWTVPYSVQDEDGENMMRFNCYYPAAAALFIGIFCSSCTVGPTATGGAILTTAYETEENTGRDHISIRYPALSGTGNPQLEERVNRQIRESVEQMVENALRDTMEYRQAQLETGGSPDDTIPIMIDVDYQLHYASKERISFVVNRCRTLANAYTEQSFFNLELPSGREFTLRDLLGENFQEIAAAEIRRQIEERTRHDGAVFFDSAETAFSALPPNHPFYLNRDGEVVIVFSKYEIAPGSMGIVEFIIPPAE